MSETTSRINVSGVRVLGGPAKRTAKAPKRTKAQTDLAEKARKVLRAEFRRAMELKAKISAEAAASGGEKGRDPEQAEKLRSIVASLEGMSRFAIAMGILTPAENRAIWGDYVKRGLYEGWR
jgi:hypothetical protein